LGVFESDASKGGSNTEGAFVASSKKLSTIFTRIPDRQRGGRQIHNAPEKEMAPTNVVIISTDTIPG
jgi:hypothetical protein